MQANTYFQSLAHGARAWRTTALKLEKEKDEEKARADDLAAKLEAKEKELRSEERRVGKEC